MNIVPNSTEKTSPFLTSLPRDSSTDCPTPFYSMCGNTVCGSPTTSVAINEISPRSFPADLHTSSSLTSVCEVPISEILNDEELLIPCVLVDGDLSDDEQPQNTESPKGDPAVTHTACEPLVGS